MTPIQSMIVFRANSVIDKSLEEYSKNHTEEECGEVLEFIEILKEKIKEEV